VVTPLAVLLLGHVRLDEVRCEEASVHLEDCCPDFVPHDLDCDWVDRGSCESDIDPTRLDVAQSECLLELDCATLVDEGICDAIIAAITPTTPGQGGAPPLELGRCR
jgi:hypothetical protein